MRDLLIGYWPLWYLATAVALVLVASWFSRWYQRRLTRARRSLTEIDAARAGRPSPAPIDVELMR